MTTVEVETWIAAPLETCFDGARDITLHVQTSAFTRERAVAGVTSGLIGPGDSVTFEGVHFGLTLRLSARVTEFEFPRRFVDTQTQGAFQSMQHTHEFTASGDGTLMRDTLCWVSPLGVLGTIADALFLRRHMEQFLVRRNAGLKRVLEAAAQS